MSRFGAVDRSVSLLRTGYPFWAQLRHRRGTDTVQTRLMGGGVTCVRGADGARFFYEEPELERSSALPELVVGSLFGHGGVQTLDGVEHQHRKRLFTDLLDAEAMDAVVAGIRQEWERRAPGHADRVDLAVEISEVILVAASDWIGLPAVDETEVRVRAQDMIAMVDGFASVGPRQWRARRARHRAEAWMSAFVEERRRRGRLDDTPLERVASHRALDGELLEPRVAAVELLNLLRPMVAVTWFAAMAARMLHRWPDLRDGVRDGSIPVLDFAQETRRFFPFAPFVGARATADLEWEGHVVPRGSLVVLDVWGTNHDPRSWPEPYRFRPERFRDRMPTPFDLVPQGGGDRLAGHRCPGEDVTLAIVMTLVPLLAGLELDGPADTALDLRRIPPDPSCRVTLRG